MRLRDWDYDAPGSYFITICTRRKLPFFGSIDTAGMHLSPLGKHAHRTWHMIPMHHPHVAIDEFVIMPNHVHGILSIHQDTVATFHETSPPSE